ncbi:MAG: phosphatase PAP2 family protein, partial [Alistipes sp.]|nr:phosphatase PAP2 family protein [Alistipes sp.]
MYTFDHNLFLWLNFDGGAVVDRLMLLASTPAAWAWLYILIFWLVWRRGGWKGLALFVVAVAIALGGADMVAGIFKHTGLLKNLLPDFPARLRPMHTPELDGMIHSIKVGGLYGTVSAHAATNVALAVLASIFIKRRWMTLLMVAVAIVVCYSRIYLAYHVPMDIALGAVTGGVCALVALGVVRMVGIQN